MNWLAGSYLYGIEDPLPGDVVTAYVDALACVARVNGTSEPETRLIHALADLLGAMPFVVSNALQQVGHLDLAKAVEPLRDRPHLIVTLYRDALLVVAADGDVDDDELAMLARVADELGITAEQQQAARDAVHMLMTVRDMMRAL